MTSVDRLSGINGSLGIKAPCRAATTANITLAGEQTIDGISCVDGDRVLVHHQTDATENGIYNVSTGNWTRAADFDGSRDISSGTLVFSVGGTQHGGEFLYVSSANPIIIGTSNIAFTEFTIAAALDDTVDAIAGLVTSADKVAYFTGVDTAALADFTTYGRSIVAAANEGAFKALVNLESGVDVQAYDADLAAIAGLTSAADKLPYFTGSATAALADFTTFGRSLVDDADADAALTTLGVSTFAKTILDDANGAAVVATIGAQPSDARLDDITAATYSQGDILYYNGTNLVNLGPGSSGQFLKTQGAGANPIWATLGGGGDMLSTNNLTDVANTATAFSNIKQAATDTASGVVELATPVEAAAGVDTTRAVTAEGVQAHFTGVLASSTQAVDGTSTTLAVTPAGIEAHYDAKIISHTTTVDFGSLAANGGTEDQAISVPGAAITDPIMLNFPNSLNNGVVVIALNSTLADTVTIRAINTTTAAINPTAKTVRATVIKTF